MRHRQPFSHSAFSLEPGKINQIMTKNPLQIDRGRIAVIVLLLVGPIIVLAILGSYYLWVTGWQWLAWWPLAAMMMLSWFLAWHWQRTHRLVKPIDFTPPGHFTERDKQAQKLVEERAHELAGTDPENFTRLQFYVDTARQLAEDLSRLYHPEAQDPLGGLTVVEILAVIELVSHDVADMVDRSVPGSHLITIDQIRKTLRLTKQAREWYERSRDVYWLISAIWNPVKTAARYGASKIGYVPLQMLRKDLVSALFLSFMQYLGYYLIELNSGRLRVGALRYRALTQQVASAAGAEETTQSAADITLLILGQVKAGKSSLINAILGEQKAKTNVIPETEGIERYELDLEGIPGRLVLLDSAGIGSEKVDEKVIAATVKAAENADLILYVLHAQNPGRQADLDMLKKLKDLFARRPEVRMPPVLGVLTHIDLLPPSLEWTPPYNWTEPKKPKEESIHDCRLAVREQLGEYLVGIVPVCTAPDRVYGINEWLLPTLSELMGEARAVLMLRVLHADIDETKFRKVWQQTLTAGKHAVRLLWRTWSE
ncbi:MAG: hypothetical protein KatS3mg105_2390 [Gemmatales bacterium]|nr:MAG: hypothetical protein KatS3mg105_2390 [Gemmatales bacterium]